MRLGLSILPFEVIVRRKPIGPIRWSLRKAMIAVALSAVLIGLGLHLARLGERATWLRIQADTHERVAAESWWLASQSVKSANQIEQSASGPGASSGPGSDSGRLGMASRLRESSVGLSRRADFYHQLAKKYRAASEHPLLPIWPDDAEP